MKTTELFNFRFVDRKREQEILHNFFSNKSESTLWIKGARGLGKTTFFNYVFDNGIPYSLCYVNIKTGSGAVDIISDLILELQKNSDIDFLSMTKNKYKKFYNGIYKNTKEITLRLFIVNKTSLFITYIIFELKDGSIINVNIQKR